MNNFKYSFYDWCINNNKKGFIDRWDYELNKCSPKEVGFGSRKECYFLCDKNKQHRSQKYSISHITYMGLNLICDQCNSFAQWGIENFGSDFLDIYWDYERNILDPFIIRKSSRNKVWIRCVNADYHESYQTMCFDFTKGNRCPYCRRLKIHQKDSFAQYHIDNIDQDFVNKYWSDKNSIDPFTIAPHSHIKVFIKCQEKQYHKDYEIQCGNFSNGQRCSYCGTYKVHELDSMANHYPKSLELWSDKNVKSPYEYSSGSEKTVYWKCENGIHKDYKRYVYTSTICDFRCPLCMAERSQSLLQEKVNDYIISRYSYKVKHERECSLIPQNPREKSRRGQLPFDNEIDDLKLIIEVHGRQHYMPNSKSSCFQEKHMSPEIQLKQRKIIDRYKRIIAHINNYHYLEIPYWTEKDESYKQLIDNKVEEIIRKVGD